MDVLISNKPILPYFEAQILHACIPLKKTLIWLTFGNWTLAAVKLLMKYLTKCQNLETHHMEKRYAHGYAEYEHFNRWQNLQE